MASDDAAVGATRGECAPLVPRSHSGVEGKNGWFSQSHRLLVVTFAFMAVSGSLIGLNKYLLQKDRFPFPLHLVLLQAAVGTGAASFLYVVKPSLFPSLTGTSRVVTIDIGFITKKCVPIAILFAGELVFGNAALGVIDLTFMQFMKEGNVVLVYALSLIVALESFSWQKLSVLLCIFLSTVLCVRGQADFSFVGFAHQGASQLCSGMRVVLVALLLSGARKLDPLSYVLVMMPCCLVFLGILLTAHPFLNDMGLGATPHWKDFALFAWPIAASAAVAFILNILMASLIQVASVVSFLVINVAKDIMIVLLGSVFLHEVVSPSQRIAFTLQVLGIFVWSMMKAFPQEFDDGVFRGFATLSRRYNGGEANAGALLGSKIIARSFCIKSPEDKIYLDLEFAPDGHANSAGDTHEVP